MSQHPENIRIGQWIVVTNQKPHRMHQDESTEDSGYIPHQTLEVRHRAPETPFEPTGIPIKVRAMSLPFLVGTPALSPDEITVIDLSRYEIQLADPKYVKVFRDTFELHSHKRSCKQEFPAWFPIK